MSQDLTDDDVRRRVRRIIQAGQRLRPELHDEVIALGAPAIPALIEILKNRELSLDKSPGDGWAPIHAARLLGELRAVAAIEPMLHILADTDALDILHDAVLQALPAIGPPAVEPTLQAHAATTDGDIRSSLAAVLARASMRDDRILALLLQQLQEEPGAAGNLAEYGDESALPALRRAFDNFELADRVSPLANHTLIELNAAIEELGGVLSLGQQAKLERALEPRDQWRQELHYATEGRTPATRPPRPGRNEACWCGSAKKYKKCHLATDEAGETAPPSNAEL